MVLVAFLLSRRFPTNQNRSTMCGMAKKKIGMKRILFFLTLFTLLLVLAACGGSSNSGDTSSSSASLSLQGELLIGTFKLEDTSLAVSSDQASQLIPLYETMQSLAASGTAATEEINAVVTQIQSTMTSQQINAIIAMELTQQDLTTVLTENGLTSDSSSASSTADTSSIQGPMGDTSAGGAGNPGAGIPGGVGNPAGGFVLLGHCRGPGACLQPSIRGQHGK